MTRTLVMIAALCAGCEGLSSTPEPVVSVLKQIDGGAGAPGACFALMTPDTPIDPELGIKTTCAMTTSPQFLAGDDLLEVVVDYGPEVEFDDSTQAPPPAIAVAIDGAQADVPVDLTSGRVDTRAFFVGTFRAPAQPSRDVRISAAVNPGFATEVPVVFENLTPPVAIELAECPGGTGCTLQGAVGSAHFRLLVPGAVPQTVALHATLDGAPLGDPVAPVTTHPQDTDTEADVALAVPAAHDGAQWVVSAQLGDNAPANLTTTIQAPAIQTALSCGTSCSLAPGDAVGLTITAPAGIAPLQAIIDTTLDGVPQLVAAPVTLVPAAGGTATGALALHAPAAGSWQIDASVAGYAAPAIVTAIQ